MKRLATGLLTAAVLFLSVYGLSACGSSDCENSSAAELQSSDRRGTITLVQSDYSGLNESGDDADYAFSLYCHNLFGINIETLNKIFSGGELTEEAIEREGKTWIKTEPFMSTEEMILLLNGLFTEDIAQRYIDEYVTGVYYEENGSLYRRQDMYKKVLYLYSVYSNATEQDEDYTRIKGHTQWFYPGADKAAMWETEIFIEFSEEFEPARSGALREYLTGKVISLKCGSELPLVYKNRFDKLNP